MPSCRFGKNIIGTVGYMGGIPSLPVEFVESLANIIQFNYEHFLIDGLAQRVCYMRPKVSLHSAARNQLADAAMGDWLVMLDTDMIHDADTVARLVWTANAYDADVVTGLYYKIAEPHFPSLYAWDEKGYIFREGMTPPDLQHPFPVDAAGAGILLVRTRLFQRMREEIPCFDGPFSIEQSIHPGGAPFGEDLSFFVKCLRLNPRPKVICSPTITSRHLRMGSVGREEHEDKIKDLTVHVAEGDDGGGDVIVMYGGQTYEAEVQEVEV